MLPLKKVASIAILTFYCKKKWFKLALIQNLKNRLQSKASSIVKFDLKQNLTQKFTKDHSELLVDLARV